MPFGPVHLFPPPPPLPAQYNLTHSTMRVANNAFTPVVNQQFFTTMFYTILSHQGMDIYSLTIVLYHDRSISYYHHDLFGREVCENDRVGG